MLNFGCGSQKAIHRNWFLTVKSNPSEMKEKRVDQEQLCYTGGQRLISISLEAVAELGTSTMLPYLQSQTLNFNGTRQSRYQCQSNLSSCGFFNPTSPPRFTTNAAIASIASPLHDISCYNHLAFVCPSRIGSRSIQFFLPLR